MNSNLEQTTAEHMAAYPAQDGRGKWHAAVKVSGVSYCGSSFSRVVLDMSAAPIYAPRDGRPHPLICKRCISYWKADNK